MRNGEAPEVESTVTADSRTATFDEQMLSYENSLVRQALLKSQGSVTKAAQLLGVSHQRLISLIKRRHRDLLSIRSPVRARKRDSTNE
jgi:transcriptional regulator with PAS, ATPase and Fis domain